MHSPQTGCLCSENPASSIASHFLTPQALTLAEPILIVAAVPGTPAPPPPPLLAVSRLPGSTVWGSQDLAPQWLREEASEIVSKDGHQTLPSSLYSMPLIL